MGLRGYLIEKYNSMDGAYTCRRLVEESDRLGIDLRIVGVHDTTVEVDGVYNKGERLAECDFVINRYKWGKTKDEINRLAKSCYNHLQGYNVFVNKFEQVKRLRSDAFIVPKYVLGTALTDFSALTEKLSLPFVAKGLESSMGAEIVLIEGRDDYLRLADKYSPSKEWLFEEFVETSRGRDIRLYSIKGEVTACMQRTSQGDFRANVALGAGVAPYEATPGMRQIAKDIYEQTALDFLGIDLMFGVEKPYFCEINVMPGLEGIEKASGVNVAAQIMGSIAGDFANG